ncbi:MAG TPA: MFS transporter [Verrucomicrobiae bacterium]|nr:MFS transporter [Verrucomicrobiae bacterium]
MSSEPVTPGPPLTGTSRGQLAARLDRLPWGRFHTVVTGALALGWALDMFEATIIGSVLGQVSKLWKLSPTQSSALVSSWVLGIFIGAIVFGHYSDRFGRKRLFIVTLVWYASFSVATALAWNFHALLVLRFLAALGVGGEYSAVTAAMVEFIPQTHRGKASALILAAASVGTIVSSLFAAYFLSHFPPDIGWRMGFAAGAVLAVAGVWVRYAIPESPRWLAAHGRLEEAEKIVGKVEQSLVAEGRPVGPYAQGSELEVSGFAGETLTRAAFTVRVKELLEHYFGRLTLACCLNFAQATVIYGMLAVLSVIILPTVKVAPQDMPFFYFVGNIGAFGGALLAAGLIDTWGRKGTMLLGFTLTSLGVFSLYFAVTPHTVMAAYTLIMFSVVWATNTAYVVSSEILPVHKRATGLGLSVAAGRVGAFFAPLLLSGLYQRTHHPGVAMVTLAILSLPGPIAALVWYFKGAEGSQCSLEAISQKPNAVV